ncbi:serine/threonine-protein kinase PLK1 [Nilaparvata lugens]|uniref:serine/threonine-protein kinase PLK1 n=1 Tax=Nilaparvata lugens TaxID=108931 RepID=UPI00193E26C2|nr:serine/threonine-protein kinase PLK1 [Nilaparvata lugens]
MALKEIVPDKITTQGYQFYRGQYMGKGTFGKCYALTRVGSNESVAGKCLSKKVISDFKVEHKIMQEINIHKKLDHRNVVKFFGYTEDSNYIYLLLELCANRSMSELIKRRKCITAFESKYYMKQIVCGIKFLHQKNIIHRDLKLGNLLISSTMTVKIADFGLAAVCLGKTRRFSMCGTPNYIAPEVLSQKGHSFEVDVWATGCILYSLLVGTPPFQTQSKQETYDKILKCKYTIPAIVPKCAANFISITLKVDPQQRPNIEELSANHFLTMGFIPDYLPSTCIIMPPRTQALVNAGDRKVHPLKDADQSDLSTRRMKFTEQELSEMLVKIKNCLKLIVLKSETEIGCDEDAEDPRLRPFIWVNSWTDFTHVYGFSFKYNDNTVGMLFNDNSTMVMLPSGKNGYYIPEANETEYYFNVDKIPNELNKKLTIMNSLRKFMFENLKNAYDNKNAEEQEPFSMVPVLHKYFTSQDLVVMYLSNATFQVNFLYDHIKLIICPVMDAVTVLNNHTDQLKTLHLDILKTYGCSRMLHKKLKEILPIIDKMLQS